MFVGGREVAATASSITHVHNILVRADHRLALGAKKTLNANELHPRLHLQTARPYTPMLDQLMRMTMGQSLGNPKFVELQPEITGTKNSVNRRRGGNRSAQKQLPNAKHAQNDEELTVSLVLPTPVVHIK